MANRHISTEVWGLAGRQELCRASFIDWHTESGMGPCDNPRLHCTHNVNRHRLHLPPSLLKGKDVKLQGVTCTKLSSFLDVDAYKHLVKGREKNRGTGLIDDEGKIMKKEEKKKKNRQNGKQ